MSKSDRPAGGFYGVTGVGWGFLFMGAFLVGILALLVGLIWLLL